MAAATANDIRPDDLQETDAIPHRPLTTLLTSSRSPPATETPHQTPDRISPVFVHLVSTLASSHQIGTTSRIRMGDLTAAVRVEDCKRTAWRIIPNKFTRGCRSLEFIRRRLRSVAMLSWLLDVFGEVRLIWANRTCRCSGKDRVVAAFGRRQRIVLPLEDFAKSRDAPCRPKFGDVLDSST
jgi:hypothetical protein